MFPGKILFTVYDSFLDTQNSRPAGQGLHVPLTHVCVARGWGLPSRHQAFACQRPPLPSPWCLRDSCSREGPVQLIP